MENPNRKIPSFPSKSVKIPHFPSKPTENWDTSSTLQTVEVLPSAGINKKLP